MEELRKKLSSNYMTIAEYFNESFSFLKIFLKKEFILSSVLLFLNGILRLGFDIRGLFLYLIIYFFIYMSLIKKVIEIIEEKKSISNKKVFGKIFLYFGALLLIYIFTFIIFVSISSIFFQSIDPSDFSSVMKMIFIIIFFISIASCIYMYFFMYFDTLYFSRDVNIFEAFSYNLHISKHQRLRKLIPLMILFSIQIIFSLVYFPNLLIISGFLIVTKVAMFLSGLLLGLMSLYSLVLSCIIYLNVEYMDLNKKNDIEIEETNIENSSRDNPKSINFIFRKSEEKDIDKIVEILEKAKIEIKKLGINQWQNGYPNRDVILSDIKNGNSYIIEDEEKIVATAALIFEKESPYSNISEGKWITDSDYSVIHRIAVDSELKNRGYSSKLLKKLEEVSKEKLVYSIKIDTHEDNKPMQRLLEKNWYVYCGIIYLDKEPSIGEKRLAFEKVLEK